MIDVHTVTIEVEEHWCTKCPSMAHQMQTYFK
jgi:hypothetical protein